jgi:8-oxo-dGTP pyrophosphatase MutT (NUDIX family)
MRPSTLCGPGIHREPRKRHGSGASSSIFLEPLLTSGSESINLPHNEDVVAALLVKGERVLLGHRHPARAHFPNCWDVIGGHVETGETDLQALNRELDEEIGISVDVEGRSPDAHLVGLGYDLRLWIIWQWQGEIRNLAPEEHDDLRWFGFGAVSDLNLADPRFEQIIAALFGR